MIECPSLLWHLDALLPLTDFVSVGTNDLFQYMFADAIRYECPDAVIVGYDVKIPAGYTRYLLFFAQMNNGTPGDAITEAAAFDPAGLSDELLDGIPGGVRDKILNWDL